MPPELVLRPYAASDVDAVYAAVEQSRAELTQWMAWCRPEYSRDDAAKWITERAAAWQDDREWEFVICSAEGAILGACGIHRIDPLHQVGEIGYWVRSSATGRGIATRATRQLCRWAFAETQLRRLELLIAVENAASRAVAEKVGAVREGVLRQRLVVGGTAQDSVLYAILKDDFQ